MDISQALTFSSSVNKQVSIITLTIAVFEASTTAWMSFLQMHNPYLLRLPHLSPCRLHWHRQPLRFFASNAFASNIIAPKGRNPTMTQVATSEPLNSLLTSAALHVFTQTDAKLYSLASLQILMTSSLVAFAFKIV
jgi:hypothetical protein